MILKRPTLLLLEILVGCSTSVVAILWIRQSSPFATATGQIADLVWVAIPVAAFVWAIIRLSLPSKYAWGLRHLWV